MSALINELLKKLASSATSNRAKGDKFERLMYEYLKAEPLYSCNVRNADIGATGETIAAPVE